MIDQSKLPGHVLDALRNRGLSDTEVRSLSPIEAFCHYCDWNGLIGWGYDLWDVASVLKAQGGE